MGLCGIRAALIKERQPFCHQRPRGGVRYFERIGFQIEQAYWFYEDIIRAEEPNLPQFQLKIICRSKYPFCYSWSYSSLTSA